MLVRRWACLLGDGPSKFRISGLEPVRSFSSSAVLLKYIKRPRNEQIKFEMVQLVDEQNKLRPPEPLRDILAQIKLRTHFVELVQEDPPVVKIGSKEAEQKARKAAKMKEKVSKMERKEIQVTWNVTDSDLDHKIRKGELFRPQIVV